MSKKDALITTVIISGLMLGLGFLAGKYFGQYVPDVLKALGLGGLVTGIVSFFKK